MTPLGVREAFGGRWSWNLTAWALTLLPGVLVVVLQEAILVPLPTGQLLGLIAVSSAAQSLVAGIFPAAIATIARRRWRIVPLPVVIGMWLTIGIVRGVAGGVVAQLLLGHHPHFPQRVVTWVIISLVWMPLFVYTAAQIEHRRTLLAEVARLTAESEREASRTRLSEAELLNSVISTVQERIRPVITEIRRSLEAVSGSADAQSLDAIGSRLTAVSSDTQALLNSDPMSVAPEPPEGGSSATRAPLTVALAIELRQPGRAALLSGLALVPTVVPIALAVDTLIAAAHIVIALIVVVAALYLGARVRRRVDQGSQFVRAAAAIGSYFLAGACGSVTLWLLESSGLSASALATALVLPAGTVVAAVCMRLAVGVGIANRELVGEVQCQQSRMEEVRRFSAARDQEVRNRLSLLMHGPVQGRLSACVMALNFHASSQNRADPVTTARVVESVIVHLAAASRDLESLSEVSLGSELAQ